MSLCPQGASIHVCHHPSAKVTVTLFPGGWGLLGRGSQLKFRGFQGRGRGWDRVSGARGPVCQSSSHPVSNGAAAPCSCPRGADERMVSPRPLATRTEAASKQEAMSPGLVASHLVKEKKSGRRGERGREREVGVRRAGGREGGRKWLRRLRPLPEDFGFVTSDIPCSCSNFRSGRARPGPSSIWTPVSASLGLPTFGGRPHPQGVVTMHPGG